jgi:uncharacterized protein (DUF1778 family)
MSKSANSGGGRIKSQGRSLVWVALDENEKKLIRTAAACVDLPMSQFLIKHGLKAAKAIVKKLNPAKPASRKQRS